MTSPDRERDLRRRQALGRIAPAVAHDINNLLSGILGYSQMALGDPGGEEARLCMEEVEKAGRRIAALTRVLQAFSPRGAGRPETFDLNGLLRDLEKYLRLLFEPDTRFSFTPGAGPTGVNADAFLLRQAVLGLAVDASELCGKQGSLSLETFPAAGGEVLLLATLSGTPEPGVFPGPDLGGIVEQCGGRLTSGPAQAGRCLRLSLPAATT